MSKPPRPPTKKSQRWLKKVNRFYRFFYLLFGISSIGVAHRVLWPPLYSGSVNEVWWMCCVLYDWVRVAVVGTVKDSWSCVDGCNTPPILYALGRWWPCELSGITNTKCITIFRTIINAWKCENLLLSIIIAIFLFLFADYWIASQSTFCEQGRCTTVRGGHCLCSSSSLSRMHYYLRLHKCLWFWIWLHSFGLWSRLSKNLSRMRTKAMCFGWRRQWRWLNEWCRFKPSCICYAYQDRRGVRVHWLRIAEAQINRWRSRELLYCAKALNKSFIFYQFMCRVCTSQSERAAHRSHPPECSGVWRRDKHTEPLGAHINQ